MQRFLLLILVQLLTTAVVFRHDVDEKEFIEKAKEAPFDQVVQLHKDQKNGKESGPSGVLINDKYVVTAAHNIVYPTSIAELRFDKFLKSFEHSNRTILSPDKLSISFNNQFYKVDTLFIHPHYNGINQEGTQYLDIAVLKLKNPVEEASNIPLNQDTNEVNKKASFAGYGQSCPAGGNFHQFCKSDEIKRAAQTKIDSTVQPHKGQNVNSLSEFVPVENEKCNSTFSREPLPLEGSMGAGDSGTGLFIKKDGQYYLAGIGSMIALIHENEDLIKECFQYGQLNYWVRISTVHEWIAGHIE